MSDEMFFSKDEKSLVRGKRVAARTETCRPCIVTTLGPETEALEGVIMDMNPFGMLIRTMNPIPEGTGVRIQMMRDDRFQEAFSDPRQGTVLRGDPNAEGFVDHGIRVSNKKIAKATERPVFIPRKKTGPGIKPTRMHTIDVTVGGPRRGRGSR